MNNINIYFTVVFQKNDDFAISTKTLINPNDTRFEDAEITANVVSAKGHYVVTFDAMGYFTACASAARVFMMNLMNAIYTDNTYTYTIIREFLYPFMQIMQNVQYQSVHKMIDAGVYAKAGLEIEALSDMRLSDAIRVLEPNDHYGNMFRRCPNCRDFEIPEVKKLGQHIKRCPCCGLKLIPWD